MGLAPSTDMEREPRELLLFLGFKYNNGEGVPQNYAKAARWYRRAAEQGDPTAQLLLGFKYASGEGVPQNYAEAVRWYRRAVGQGDADAQYDLGLKYLDGEGVPQDYARAYGWFNLAASRFPASEQSRRDEAVEMRDQAVSLLTPAGVAARDRFVAAWTGIARGGCGRRCEARTDSGDGLRVVRVGTPRSQARLTNIALGAAGSTSRHHDARRREPSRLRLSQAGRGGGHRATAVSRSRELGTGQTAPRDVRAREHHLECRVSEAIGRMPFLWIEVPDEPGPVSLRGVVERNAIALLSNYERPALDPPSRAWLGHGCPWEKVRGSGLWNKNHVDEAYDPAFLDALERLIANMGRIGSRSRERWMDGTRDQ